MGHLRSWLLRRRRRFLQVTLSFRPNLDIIAENREELYSRLRLCVNACNSILWLPHLLLPFPLGVHRGLTACGNITNKKCQHKIVFSHATSLCNNFHFGARFDLKPASTACGAVCPLHLSLSLSSSVSLWGWLKLSGWGKTATVRRVQLVALNLK